MNGPFAGRRLPVVLVGAVIVALIIVLLVDEFALDRPAISGADDRAPGNCSVARMALDAFDHGRAPPPEWIEDRAAAAAAVKNCERR